jgi:hypothetical protein
MSEPVLLVAIDDLLGGKSNTPGNHSQKREAGPDRNDRCDTPISLYLIRRRTLDIHRMV